jgi:hypothetical protein
LKDTSRLDPSDFRVTASPWFEQENLQQVRRNSIREAMLSDVAGQLPAVGPQSCSCSAMYYQVSWQQAVSVA